MGSAAVSVPFSRPTSVYCFLGVVNLVWIPAFVAIETSEESEKY
jgi:hypothetical protein